MHLVDDSNVHTKLVLPLGRPTIKGKEMLRNTKDDNLIFVVFCGCFALLFICAMHFAQQQRLVQLQIQIDELKIVVDQKFLPAMILDKETLMVR
jgi:hypothetical protein